MKLLLIPALCIVAGCSSCTKQEEQKILRFEEDMFEIVDDEELNEESVEKANKECPRAVAVKQEKVENPERAAQL